VLEAVWRFLTKLAPPAGLWTKTARPRQVDRSSTSGAKSAKLLSYHYHLFHTIGTNLKLKSIAQKLLSSGTNSLHLKGFVEPKMSKVNIYDIEGWPHGRVWTSPRFLQDKVRQDEQNCECLYEKHHGARSTNFSNTSMFNVQSLKTLNKVKEVSVICEDVHRLISGNHRRFGWTRWQLERVWLSAALEDWRKWWAKEYWNPVPARTVRKPTDRKRNRLFL